MSDLVRSPELGELRTFCAAAEAGSLGRAALRLNVSQPALTKRLQSLERLAGVQLLERSPRGVKLTPAGRRLYEEARRLLEHASAVEDVMVGLGRRAGPVRLASSHSATEAFVADALAAFHDEQAFPVELLSANSSVVRGMVADGRADLGVAAVREGATPNPGVRPTGRCDDASVCAVPRGHPGAQRGHVTLNEFLRTPMVLRDPESNARWTVEAKLRERGLRAAEPAAQASTPAAARREALRRNVPVLLSHRVLDEFFAVVAIDGLDFPRRYDLVLPAVGDPDERLRVLVQRLQAAAAGLSASSAGPR